MYKAKLCSFVIAGLIGFIGLSPITAFAAETNTESITLSESSKKQNNNHKAAFSEKLKKASENWNKLTKDQKTEIYSLLEEEMEVEKKLLDKLVEFGVFEDGDVNTIKSHMDDRMKSLKESGEFPFYNQKKK